MKQYGLYALVSGTRFFFSFHFGRTIKEVILTLMKLYQGGKLHFMVSTT